MKGVLKMTDIEQFVKERDEAVLTLNPKMFRVFYLRWMNKGVYTQELPDDDSMIEIAMRKCICCIASATEEQKADASAWLHERGLSAGIE